MEGEFQPGHVRDGPTAGEMSITVVAVARRLTQPADHDLFDDRSDRAVVGGGLVLVEDTGE